MENKGKRKSANLVKTLIAAALAAATIGACVACTSDSSSGNAAKSGQNTQPISVPEDL